MSGSQGKLSVALLRRLLGAEAAERSLGDLEEVHARVRALRGGPAARRAVLREAGLIVVWAGLDRLRRLGEPRSAARTRRGGRMFDAFLNDVRHGARGLLRRPAFAAVVVAVLGLGIGANVAIFTLADRLFVRPAPLVESPESLVRVFRSWGVPDAGGALSYPDYLDYRDGATTVAGLAAYATSPVVATARVDAGSAPARVLTVTADYFDVLGIAPASGRFFRADENATVGTHAVAVVSWGFWQDRLGGTADVVGREVGLNGRGFTVIGVAPRGFRGLAPAGDGADVYIPILMRDAIAPSSDTAWRERVGTLRDRWLSVVGRLRPGATVAAAQEELARIADGIRALEQGDPEETVLVTAEYRWFPRTAAQLGGLTRVLLIAVGLLLACAAANVAILLLARASTRDREMGIRTALGAGRGRISRLLVAESLLLGLAGCGAGLVVAAAGARVAASLLPIPLDVPLVPDARMLGVALATALVTSLAVGVAPAWHATRRDVLGTIQGRDRNAGGGRVRDALVVVQIALSLVLVSGAALFARSLAAARAVEVGFEPAGVLLVGVNLANHGYDADRGRVFIAEALDRLRALPSVERATVTRQVPFRGDWTTDLEPWPGASFADGRTTLTAGLNTVGPDYFDVMRIPVLRGRALDATDVRGSPPVVVVNETFAQLAYAEGDALGATVRRDTNDFRIVGIVRDAKYYELGEERWPQVYLSVQQSYASTPRFALRTSGDPLALVAPAQRVLHGLDPDVAFASVETLEAVHAEQYARFRASAHVVGLTGLIALLLASAGLYGVMAFRVSQRTREIGVRMALGATRGALAASVLRRGLGLALPGILLGTALSLALGRLVEALLFGVTARDARTLALAPVVLVVVAVLAVLVPARRATRIDPMRAMRAD